MDLSGSGDMGRYGHSDQLPGLIKCKECVD